VAMRTTSNPLPLPGSLPLALLALGTLPLIRRLRS
jgi:MYXO-CTERM domain-containing protein